jgi:Rrf2 family protein
MMHMTQEADYAVRIVYCLAESGVRRDARYVSEKMGVSLRFSLKILGKLVTSGILKSFQGQNGGYELARSPREISLGDVIATVDGPYAINKCLKDGHTCNMDDAEACNFRQVYAEISDIITDKLDGVTFERLLAR